MTEMLSRREMMKSLSTKTRGMLYQKKKEYKPTAKQWDNMVKSAYDYDQLETVDADEALDVDTKELNEIPDITNEQRDDIIPFDDENNNIVDDFIGAN